MRWKRKRASRYYDSPALTAKPIGQLLPKVLADIGKRYQDRPDLILAAWPEMVGAKLAPMTQAVSFVEGILTVKVANSSLYSLLVSTDKSRIIKNLRDKFPGTTIKTIHFRLG